MGGGDSFPRKKRYKGVRSNVISVTRGWVGVKYPGKKHYVTLENDPPMVEDTRDQMLQKVETLIFTRSRSAGSLLR